ncbi:MAG: glycine cleavage system protein H [Deltaproteobacteria bacterium]|nr:glycine cleavage system protein H [Deltaproteobacteria bacterium]MBW1941513.1 glycine cleavage system protein H [Deltaproteobacteria bacterium]MBW2208410.1 glycine cleavage system protein H [Deltaproteobacteria bacterium]
MDKKAQEKKKRVIGFQVVEDECIWMKAGVVNFRLCDNAYDCYNCPFDIGMRKAMNLNLSDEKNKEKPGWVQYLQERYHGASRPCRHALTGHIDAPKICTMNYECYHCPYDQILDELDLGGIADVPSYRNASGYRMAEGYYYHMGHSWARFEHGGRVRVGFDDFLAKLFGPIEILNLPPLGATLKQSQVGWTFSRDEHKAAVLSPVTGSVLATNHRALKHPGITNRDPYQEGWLFILEPRLPKKDLKGLYFGDQGFRWMEEEDRKLMSLMGPEYEQLAATGGELIGDIFGNFPGLGWDRLVHTFLGTEKA